MPSLKTRRDKGVALLTALALTTAISALALATTRETRTVVRVAANEVAAARAGAAAEAGIERLLLVMASQSRDLSPAFSTESISALGGAIEAGASRLDDRKPTPIDGRPLLWRFGDANVLLLVQAERGKFDLNKGDPRILVRLLDSIGATDSETLADMILAPRKKSGLARGVSWRLSDHPFNSVDDLAATPDLDADVFRALAPLVTTHSGRVEPDPVAAPEPLWRALPMTDDQRVLSRQNRSDPPSSFDVLGAEAFTVVAESRMPDGTWAGVYALAVVDALGGEPVRIIERRRLSTPVAWLEREDQSIGATAPILLAPAPILRREW